MRGKGKISVFQFFSILFVCRVIAFFTFVIANRPEFSPENRMTLFLPFILLGLLMSVPALIIIGKNENGTVFDLTNRLSSKLTKLVGVIYAAGALWSAAVNLTRFELFMSTVMYPGTELLIFILIILSAAILIARTGLEAAGRMSVIIIAVLGVSLAFVAITTVKDFEYTNLNPPFLNGILPLIKSGFTSVSRTSEIAALLIFAPKINGKIKKGLGIWLAALGATISALFTLILGVTGEYGEQQMFQLYALTVLAKIGAIERLDALICAIWVLCSLMRLSFYLYTSELFFEGGFRVKKRTSVYIAFSVIILAGYVCLSKSVSFFSNVLSSGINEILFTAILAALPMVLIIADKIKLKIGGYQN